MSLPYKVGKLYRPIDGYWKLPDNQEYYGFLPYVHTDYYDSSNVSQGYFEQLNESDVQGFLPISFNEQGQQVVLEVVVPVRTHPVTKLIMGANGGLSFDVGTGIQTESKIVRIKVPVEEFIKNYELIL